MLSKVMILKRGLQKSEVINKIYLVKKHLFPAVLDEKAVGAELMKA